MSADDEVLSYGVLQRRELRDAIDAHVEEIEVLGFTVIEDAVGSERLAPLRAKLDALHAAQAGKVTFAPDEDLVRCPLAQDEAFLAPATDPQVLEISRRLLGDNLVLLQQNAILNRPATAQHQSRWHRDLPYQHFVSSKRLALNALLALDDFTEETGGTFVLPGSHMFEAFPSARLVKAQERVARARAGAPIITDAMPSHRAGANNSKAVRRGLNHVIGRPLLVQQIDIPRMLNGRHANDPVLAPYLGYRWNPAPDVAAWQAKRT